MVVFTSDYPTRFLYDIHIYQMRAKCPAQLILLDFATLILNPLFI
jgi:hypothetical protein